MRTIFENEEIEVEYNNNTGVFCIWSCEDNYKHFVAGFTKDKMKEFVEAIQKNL